MYRATLALQDLTPNTFRSLQACWSGSFFLSSTPFSRTRLVAAAVGSLRAPFPSPKHTKPPSPERMKRKTIMAHESCASELKADPVALDPIETPPRRGDALLQVVS